MLTVSSVFKSQWVELEERPRVWKRTVLPIMGTFGSTTLTKERGEDVSMMSDLGMGWDEMGWDKMGWVGLR